MTTKYPDAMELVNDAYLLASNFPYLDIVIAVTSWDERPYDEKIGDWYDNPTLTQILKEIAIGVHIKDGNISILEKSDAAALYKSYRKQYGKKKVKSDDIPVMDIEYFEKLAKANNLKREDFLNCI